MPPSRALEDRGDRSPAGGVLGGLLWWLGGVAGAAVGLQGMLQSRITAAAFFSVPTWHGVVRRLGGTLRVADPETADVPFAGLFVALAAVSAAWTLVPALVAVWRPCSTTRPSGADCRGGQTAFVSEWAGTAGVVGRWMLLVLAWEALRLCAAMCDWGWLALLMAATPNLFVAAALAGILAALATRATFVAPVRGHASPAARTPATDAMLGASRSEPASGGGVCGAPRALWFACVVYVAVFALMNWRLWVCLRIPHGDSAMYEEHLWNVLHGKGFRSYLDQGLFLGEHIQVAHLLLLPVYWLWPHHMLLELAESAALAAGAVAVFRITERAGARPPAALALGIAYLLYFPLQYLDIAVDLKTFRPISFGVPLMLFAIDQWERRRFGVAAVLVVLTLACKEDFAIVLAGWGAWMALSCWWANRRRLRFFAKSSETGPTATARGVRPSRTDAPNGPQNAPRPEVVRREMIGGAALALFSAVYLIVATRLVIPWFRGGQEVHYARYFSRFGESLTEIAWNMLTHPAAVLGEVFGVGGILYALLILLPLGFLPCFSPGRLLAGGPLFVLLCLNEIARDPRHHFHAPLLPLVFWAAAWGLARLQSMPGDGQWPGPTDRTDGTSAAPPQLRAAAASQGREGTRRSRPWRLLQAAVRRGMGLFGSSQPGRTPEAVFAAHLCWASALATGIFWSIAPYSIAFWDPGSHWYWRRLYVADERVAEFARIFPMIPRSARVASTDYIHPRFTHHERSYDYSRYRRKVAGYRDTVPPDTDYIVIDCRGPYAEIRRPEQVPELQRYPQCWDIVPEATSEYFIVLKRNWRNCPRYPPEATGAERVDSGG